MRLIDANELISILGFENTQEERDENVWKIIIIALEGIDRIPTAYDPDKVVKQLEDRSTLSRPVGWPKSYALVAKLVYCPVCLRIRIIEERG